MSFGRRLTADLDVIHSCDPALAGVDSTVLDSYLLSRDISVLPKDAVAGATIFTVRPLGVESEHLVTLVHEPQAMRAIFRKHVCACRGPMGGWLVFETTGGKRQVTEQSTEEVTLDVIAEIVTVIVQAASRRGDSAPFSPPDSWRQNRRLTARAKALAALIAPTGEDAPTDKMP
jgi:hypothetical protein